jgi:SAM-dependent methyltransferase
MAWADYDQLAAVDDRDRAVPLEALEPWRAALAAYLPPASGLPVGRHRAVLGRDRPMVRHRRGGRGALRGDAPPSTRHPRAHPRVAWVGGLVEQLPLRDGCGDSAWLSTVLHHLSDLATCAGELRRVVRPGGWVLARNAF